jgi:hypothetical protein
LDKANACFQAVYVEKYLENLPVFRAAEKAGATWASGACQMALLGY